MRFPEVQRVIYGKSPLIEVAFQVRFPRFLTIETEPPSEFQRLIISDFPIYEQRQVFQFSISTFNSERSEAHSKIHAFQTPDRNYTVMLSSDNLAITSARYERWENFIAVVRQALDAFHQTYRLPIFNRLGLRYVNVINRADLGLAETAWRELLQPHIAGDFLGPTVNETDFLAKNTAVTLKIEDGDHLLLRHGLVTQTETKALAYLIDSDFYNEEQRNAGLDATVAVANRLHTNAGRLFKWCISDVLHNAMDPRRPA
jgi:uncharacterized protein (TIGR04255 family)